MTFLIVIKPSTAGETIRHMFRFQGRSIENLLHAEGDDANGRQAVEILCSYYNDYGAQCWTTVLGWNGELECLSGTKTIHMTLMFMVMIIRRRN